MESQSQSIEQRVLRNWKYIIVGFIALVILIACWPLRSVPTGFRGVITVGGSIKQVEGEGFTLLWPWQRLDVFSIRAEQADIEKAEGATSDTQPVHVSMTVRYAINPDKVAFVFEQYSHDGNLASYVQTATQEIFKAVTARYTAPDLIAQRAKVSNDIGAALREKLQIYGANVINIDMRNFAFSPEYMAAINAKVTQEQQKLAEQNKVLTIEAQQRAKVVTAEAEAKAVKAQADGAAYATITEAKAEAQAVRVKGQASADAMRAQANAISANPDLIRMEIAKRWDGSLPQWMTPGAPLPLLNVEAPKARKSNGE